MNKLKTIRHGEIMLVPVNSIPKNYTQVFPTKDYVVGHSETGHHHVLESKVNFEIVSDKEKQELFFRLFKPAKLVHKKVIDRHKDLVIPAGIYKRFHDTEYSPWDKIIREVKD